MLESAIRNAPQIAARILDHEPLGHLGMPEEVAEVVGWLCSPTASFVTTHRMAIDSGITSWAKHNPAVFPHPR